MALGDKEVFSCLTCKKFIDDTTTDAGENS